MLGSMARSRCRAVLLAGAALAACTGPSLTFELPAEVRARHDFAAAIALDDSGAPRALSGVAEVEARLELELPADAELGALDVVLWDAAQLPGLVDADRSLAQRTPLRVAETCEATLAAPAEVLRLSGTGAPIADRLPLVSAMVRGDACLPGWTRNLAVEARCLRQDCAGALSERGCEAELDLSDCGLGRFRLRAQDGAPCAERLGEVCTSARPLASGGVELSCPGRPDCELRFHAQRPTTWARVARVAVSEQPARTASDLSAVRLRSYHRYTGYLGPVVALGDEVGVVSRRGAFLDRPECDLDAAADLVWYSPELARVRTTTVPGCTSALQALPDGRAALIAWTETSSVYVGLLDPARGVVRRQRVPIPDLRAAAVSAVTLAPDGRRVVLAVTSVDLPSAGPRGHLLVVEPATLAVTRFVLPDNAVFGLAIEDDEVAFVGDTEDLVGWIDPDTGRVSSTEPVPSTASVTLGDLAYDAATERLFLALPSEDTVLYTFRRRKLAARLRVPDGPWRPTTLLRLGPGAGALLVGSTLGARDGTYTAGLSRIAAADDGVLPGVIPLGWGVVGQHTRTPDGALWATLPWSGELLRIEATPPDE